MIYLGIAIYAAAIVLANLLVLQFGPVVTAPNAFFLIGLDLALRNWLNLRMRPFAMGLLILSTGMITYLVNDTAQRIAIASALAFTLASLADWLTFQTAAGAWMRRSVFGTTVGAAVDSIVFPTMAFGALLPAIVLAQFACKVLGGTIWAFLLRPRKAAEAT